MNTPSPEMTFSEASTLWLESRLILSAPGPRVARFIRPNTEMSYREYLKSLCLFFGSKRLADIGYQDLRRYQEARVQGAEPFIRRRRPHEQPGPCPCKPKKVNQELACLIAVMQKAGAWTDLLQQCYKRLIADQEDELPRALTPEQQSLWIQTAASQPRWKVVHWYSLLAFNTCMSTDEIRGLRLGDVNLRHETLSIPRRSAKNKYRCRTIELVGPDVRWALEQLIEHAHELGSSDPGHYIFSFRNRAGQPDPTRPMTTSGLKRAWAELRRATGLTWFRQYDCRHTAISRLAEQGIPSDVIMERAGHVSERMRQHYTHISQAAQRRCLEQAAAQGNTPKSPRRAAPARRAALDLTHPDIQAEIARQVALALQEREESKSDDRTLIRPRLLRFPGSLTSGQQTRRSARTLGE